VCFIYLYNDSALKNPSEPPFWIGQVKQGDALNVFLMTVPKTVQLNGKYVAQRRNQKTLSTNDQKKFLDTINSLNTIPAGKQYSVFGELVAIHGQMVHDMHGFMGPWGTQRFLAWHRIYLQMFEQALRQVQAEIAIPYWDWSVDRAIPSWIAGFLPTVTVPGITPPVQVVRNAGDPKNLPTAQNVTDLLANTDFTTFTSVVPRVLDGAGLEGMHNDVHDWFPQSTMNTLAIAPADPIFWMHHANTDRLWALWQYRHAGQNPNLPPNAMDDENQPANVMDPWTGSTEANTRDTIGLGYTYI
jgi:tyrosinase